MAETPWGGRAVSGFLVAVGLAVVAACNTPGSPSRSSAAPTAPTQAAAAATSETADDTVATTGAPRPGGEGIRGGVSEPSDVAFPPRDEAFRFRQDLEAYYRDVFRRGASSSFVDIEGTIVWTQEYLRYRVNGCNHDTAVSRVLAQIDGSTNTAGCTTASTPFPPRNEPFAFRQTLETKYRDGLRRSAGATFVDTEGDIVWTQEYLRYRTTGCNDAQATDRVRQQLAGAGPPAGCSTTTSTTSTTTSTVPPSPNPIASFTVSGRPCSLTDTAGGQRVNCTFDGTGSRASTGTTLTSHTWTIGNVAFGSNPVLSNPFVPCGSQVAPGNFTFELPVTLTVRDTSGQTAVLTQSVQFQRTTGCSL